MEEITPQEENEFEKWAIKNLTYSKFFKAWYDRETLKLVARSKQELYQIFKSETDSKNIKEE